MEVTPSASTNIQTFMEEYLREEEERARKKPIDKMLIVNIEALVFSTTELGLDIGITSISLYFIFIFCRYSYW